MKIEIRYVGILISNNQYTRDIEYTVQVKRIESNP